MHEIRRGHLKFYVLRLLSEERRTGYGLMKAIEAETGFWRPSAGSLYPLLAAMREAKLIREVEEADGTARWEVTDEGTATYAQAAETKQELLDSMRRSLVVFAKVFDAAPIESFAERLTTWDEEGRPDFSTLGPLFMDLHDALWALPSLSGEQEEQIQEILGDALAAVERIAEGTGKSSPPPVT